MSEIPIYFASSNENKFFEIQKLLDAKEKIEMIYRNSEYSEQKKINIYFKKLSIKEIQSESIIEVAEDKVKKAFDIIKSPVIIEDDGLFIDDLNGFPGIYSSFVDGKIMESFSGETIGHITTKISPEGWGFDPIFKPENEDKTYGQINILK